VADKRVALISGAGAGLGLSVAKGLAARGCTVVIADINAEAGAQAVDAIKAGGGAADFIQVDLSTPDGGPKMVERALALHGQIDILVNNAGFGRGESFLKMKAETWDLTFALNVRSVALAMSAVAEPMKRRGGGRIINITSPAARLQLPDYLAYSATKAAVDSVTRGAAIGLAPMGIRVNSVAPGPMVTALQKQNLAEWADVAGVNDHDAFEAAWIDRMPLKRVADCDEVAAGVIWLALDAPDYVLGERLSITGGMAID